MEEKTDLNKKTISVLIIDKDESSASFLSQILGRRFERLEIANSADNVIERLGGGERFDIVVMETLLIPWSYADFVSELRRLNPSQKIVILSGHREIDILVDSIQLNVDGFILKPASVRQIVDTMTRVTDMIENERERLAAETALKESHEQMLTILDNLDSGVYVADMQTYEVLYGNRFFTEILGDIVGKRCWEVIQAGQTGPCSFCTNDKLLNPDGSAKEEPYRWEFQNTKTGHWFEIADKAIRWIDGRIVRLEIATDITKKKIGPK